MQSEHSAYSNESEIAYIFMIERAQHLQFTKHWAIFSEQFVFHYADLVLP